MNKSREALSPPEVAEALGIGIKEVRRILASGDLPAIRLGPRIIRVPTESLRAWMRERAHRDAKEGILVPGRKV